MMRRKAFTYALTAVLFALFLTAAVSAQIRFAGNKNGLEVNGKIVDTGNLNESLLDVVEILRTQSGNDSFAAYTTGGFPMRARINGVVYEVWRDRIVESCDTLKANHEIQVGLQPSDTSQRHQILIKGHLRHLDPNWGYHCWSAHLRETRSKRIFLLITELLWIPSMDRSDGMTADNSIISTFVINDKGDTLVERTRNFNYSNMVKVFPDQDLWVDTQQMQVSSDEHDLMVVQRADGQTTDMWHRYFKVPDYGQAGLMLSDIMPAYSVEQTENGISSEHE